ncbi:MAG: transposase [Richelia sp.]|nr:transposase [Richelia sp.]
MTSTKKECWAKRHRYNSHVQNACAAITVQHNISDEELEYQVNDRLSFMTFLGLGLAEPLPDATTVWLFRQQLKQQGLIEELFEQLI